MTDLVEKRRTIRQDSYKSGHAARDDHYFQAIDKWIVYCDKHQKVLNTGAALMNRKLADLAEHDKKRMELSRRLGNEQGLHH